MEVNRASSWLLRRPLFDEGAKTCDEAGGAVRDDLGIPRDVTVLCNFLQTWKIDPPIFHLWMDSLAHNLTDAHLLLWEQSDDTRVNLGSEARKRHR